jgi:DNA-binding NarL/FixJ family response regulator
MNLIKLVIADANTLLREGLKRILSAETDLLVVGEAANDVEVAQVVERTKPDVLLLDLKIPEGEAVPIIAALRQKNLPTRILILSGFSGRESILNTARAGACGCVLKQTPCTTLIQAIRSVHKGETWVDRQLGCAETFLGIARRLRIHNADGREDAISRALSKRERQILSHVARGLTNQEISERLLIRLSTVKVHLSHVFKKLSVNNRTQAVLFLLNANQYELPADLGLRIESGAPTNSLLNHRVFGDLSANQSNAQN